MREFFTLASIILVILSCSNPDQKTDTGINDNNDTLQKVQKPEAVKEKLPVINHSKLLGAWTDHSTENATFDIQKDSIFYVDALESYPYKLIGDSIVIQFPDYKYQARIWFKGDTLIMHDRDNVTTKFTRFRN